jgi:predicted RNA binding protein YcfA (HicA-like mRNA interferase family)
MSTRKRVYRVREAIRIIEQRGWYLVATRGSHRQYRHPTMPGRVTIPGNRGDELSKDTWHSIMFQARILR